MKLNFAMSRPRRFFPVFSILVIIFMTTIAGQAQTGDRPVIMTSMPMMSQRAVSRFDQATFERVRHRQLSLAATMLPESGDCCETSSPISGGTVLLGQYGTCDVEEYACDPITCAGMLPSCGGSFWFQNYGDFLNQQGRSGVDGYRMDSYGFSFGYDTVTGCGSVLGVAVGGAFSDAGAKSQYQKSDGDSFLVSAYGGRTFCNWNLVGTFGYVHTDFDNRRVLNSDGDLAESHHHGSTLFGGFEISNSLFQGHTSVTPFLSLELIGMDESACMEENKALGHRLRFASENSMSYLQTLGLRFERSYFECNGWLVNPSLSLGWLHDYGAGFAVKQGSLNGGAPYSFRGVPMNKNRFVTSLNVSASLGVSRSVFLRYDGEFNKGFNAQTVHFGFGLGY